MENTVKSVSLGYGCKRCSKRHQYSTEEWIQIANQIHNGKYNYHHVNYIDSHTKVLIECPKHGLLNSYRLNILMVQGAHIVHIKNFTLKKV